MSSPKAPAFSFDELAQATFTTSPTEDELTTAFATERLALPGRNYAARLAIGRSLAIVDQPPVITDTRGARAIRGQQLFGTGVDLRTWVTLIIEHAGLEMATLEDIQDLVRRHWARGIQMLDREWKHAEEDHDRFVLRLGELAGLPHGEGERGPSPLPAEFVPKAQPVNLPLGPVSTDASSSEPVTFALNALGMSPHVALLGSLGTGKSRAAVHMLAELHRQAAGCPVLVFDMKGDLSRNQELVAGISAKVIELPSSPIQLDVLHAGQEASEQALFDVELRFRESFARIPEGGRLGELQKSAIGEAARRALRGRKPVKLEDVHSRLKEVYAENKRKEDTAIITFNDMSRLKLFTPELSPEAFFSKSWILNLSGLSKTARRLAAFLVLDAAYAYLKRCGDTAIDAAGNRALRLALFVDEAREVLAYQQESLIGLVRESRSQGGAVFMATQSPGDFYTGEENFLDNIGLGLCLKTNANPRELRHLLGQDQDLAGLETGVAVARVGRDVRKVQLWSTGR